MSDIYVVAEHRQGELRDITFEMLTKARALCQAGGHSLTAVLLADEPGALLPPLAERAEKVLFFQDPRLEVFDPDLYRDVLAHTISQGKPLLTLMGHTPSGLDYAPALSIRTGLPLATDCVDIQLEGSRPKLSRQIYSGKLFAKVGCRDAESYLITVRPSAFQPEESTPVQAEVVQQPLPGGVGEPRRTFIEFVDTSAGAVDIAQAPFLLSIGRGVGEEENITVIQELAERLGATLSCSRPVVDKNWLPKYHQVGTSGKSVKPKVYLALGISGAFQHVAGIAGAGTVIAVNKDKKAPIFRVADYGVVEDLFKIAEALKEKING